MPIRRLSVCLVAVAGILAGQTVSTQILGLVSDTSGAVVPGAVIKVTRIATGDVRTTRSNDTGNYVFPLLDIGEYEVSCSAAGFKTDVRRHIVLQLQDKLRIDFQLTVGQQAETIEVAASAPILNTDDATLGSVVDPKRIVELPLNGRNFGQLATLAPGVTYGSDRMGINGQGTIGTRAMPGQIVGLSSNGQRDINQNITLDGVTAVDSFKNAMLFVPSIEAVEEFKIQTGAYSAEYGMNSGAQANVVVRSGANQFHARAFEFVRNDAFDARGFFLAPGAVKNELRRNQFGGVASGHIKKDKTFWLVSYEGRREVRATPALTTVPTLAMRAGDFSEFLKPGNRWYPTTPVSNLAVTAPGSNAPFPNNIIPPSFINPVSENLLTYKKTSPFPQGGFIPLPNIDPQAQTANRTLNLAANADQVLNSDQVLTRVDHRFSDNDRLFGRYALVRSAWTNDPINPVGDIVTGYRAQNLAIGYTKILSPTVFNDLRFGLNRVRANTVATQTNSDFVLSDLGLNFPVIGTNRALTPREEGIPSISMVGFAGTGSGNVTFNVNNTYEADDSVSVLRGKHNLKFGGQYRFSGVENDMADTPRGQINFTRDIVGVPDAFAAFLLGYPLNVSSAQGVPPQNVRQQKVGIYALDDFKATSRLTVNYGLRWDWYGPVTDPGGRIRNLSFANSDVKTVNGQLIPLLVPNPYVSQVLYDINYRQFMPRLGIVYRLRNTMVLRVASGLFYSPQQTNNFNILNQNPPFSGTTVFQNDAAHPVATISNPFAGVPVGGGPAALTNLGHLNPNDGNRSMYLNNKIWQWTAEIEQSFGKDFVAAIGYVGSAASDLDMAVSNFNNPDPGLGNVQTRRPYPYYADSRDPNTLLQLGTVHELESWTSANYNALQLRAEKRYSKGLTFNTSFTYQRANSIGYSVNESGPYGPNFTQDPRNRKADYGRSQIDQRFRFVFSHVWEIPWLRQAKGIRGAMLGGWSVNGIVQFSSGLPVTVGQAGDSQNTGPASAPRPNIVPGKTIPRVWSQRSISQWFDTSAFVQSKCNGCPGNGVYVGPLGYGDAGVSLFDSPGQKTWDFALFKEFRILEAHRLQVRWEVFNFTNTPQFAGPNASLGGSSFGAITSTVVDSREMQFGLKYLF